VLISKASARPHKNARFIELSSSDDDDYDDSGDFVFPPLRKPAPGGPAPRVQMPPRPIRKSASDICQELGKGVKSLQDMVDEEARETKDEIQHLRQWKIVHQETMREDQEEIARLKETLAKQVLDAGTKHCNNCGSSTATEAFVWILNSCGAVCHPFKDTVR
jgi:hypothetical protein